MEVLATNILSPLGYTTEDNYRAVLRGESAIKAYSNWHGMPLKFAASLFSPQQNEELMLQGFTRFQSIAIRSIGDALRRTDVDPASPRTLFILSTTKADVEELGAEPSLDGHYSNPVESAGKIARFLGFSSKPMVVCNACISGVNAQVLAKRMLDSGAYDHAVVCGADCQSPFIVSGFCSFKAVSPYPCRPFDMERLGLNPGEAAATMIFGRTTAADNGRWKLSGTALDNDAYHASAPVPDGDGCRRVLEKALGNYDRSRLATISVHGTATMFNDQMESKAIEAAGLSDLPLSALKGYYGHTMGAAGILESIITMRALDDGCVLPSRGFAELGVSGRVNISAERRTTDKRSFVKIISGFGGCNGALLFTKETADDRCAEMPVMKCGDFKVKLTPESLSVGAEMLPVEGRGKEMLTAIYKKYLGDNPKFYKMDMLGRVAYIATEMLLRGYDFDAAPQDRMLILFNRNSSVLADRSHISTISDANAFFPSPSVFLYTLPNIVSGEIAIKHRCKGETSFYILEEDDLRYEDIVRATLGENPGATLIYGIVDCTGPDSFCADMNLITNKQQ